MRIRTLAATAAAACAGVALAVAPAQAATGHSNAQDPLSSNAVHAAGSATDLSFGGGPIVNSPSIYIVYWGSQWSSDPTGEKALQLSFFQHAYGSGDTHFTSQTQYCQGVATGTKICPTTGTHVGHPTANPVKGTWADSTAASPSKPTNAQLAAEAKKAAAHFGVSGKNIQIIVDSAHGVVPTGFGSQYCAWHDKTTSSTGAMIPYTNMPYVSDAGSGCGASFVTPSNGVSGASEGVTIVGGHEYAETLTDPNASTGWLDSSGEETGDKCAWVSSGQGASAIISLNGSYYAVQSLWSNNFNSDAGGCVNSYTSPTNQH